MLNGAPGTAGLNPLPPPAPLGVAGFGVVDLPSSDRLVAAGAGVEEAEERPLLGEAGSFFALPDPLEAAEAGPRGVASPFSLGGERRRPFCCGETALTCEEKRK